MIPVRILGTASLLPGPAVTTTEVANRVGFASSANLQNATGIRERHWAPAGTRCTDLGATVLGSALQDAGLAARQLQRLIFVSSAGGDWLCPATATAIIGAMGLDGACAGFDLSNSCVGFLSALDIGARYVATGVSCVAIVVVETLSRGLSPSEFRPYVVLGDAAAAVILGPARPGEGIEALQVANAFAGGPTVQMEHPLNDGKVRPVQFVTANEEMGRMATTQMTASAHAVLSQAGISIEDVDWVVPHQPNGRMLAMMIAALDVDPGRVLSLVQETGSIAAAALPVSLDHLRRSDKLAAGQRVLMLTVGSPLVSGAALYRVAP